MIEINNLVKKYGPNTAVSDISFKISEGEIVGFLGPNGAGKSTTMNILAGYLAPTSGSASVNGIDITQNPKQAKAQIGYLPEHPPLYLDMLVCEYLDFVADLKGFEGDRKKHIDQICQLVAIGDVKKRLIGNLSKGYRQRVGLAQALINDPPVLILDEPTVGLDPKQIVEIRNVIKALGKKRTIILSTHILPEVSAVCERAIVISKGKLVADDHPDALSALVSGTSKLVVRVAGAKDVVTRTIKAVDGVSAVQATGQNEKDSYDYVVESRNKADVRKPMFNALSAAGCPILMLKPVDASLEDVFVKLVSK